MVPPPFSQVVVLCYDEATQDRRLPEAYAARAGFRMELRPFVLLACRRPWLLLLFLLIGQFGDFFGSLLLFEELALPLRHLLGACAQPFQIRVVVRRSRPRF